MTLLSNDHKARKFEFLSMAHILCLVLLLVVLIGQLINTAAYLKLISTTMTLVM